jgi:hypothetical protein
LLRDIDLLGQRAPRWATRARAGKDGQGVPVGDGQADAAGGLDDDRRHGSMTCLMSVKGTAA